MPKIGGYYSTDNIKGDDIGRVVDSMKEFVSEQRASYERSWYDNNFFDDGHHFRYYSRSENKIVDLSARESIYNPIRAIPKASKQIRGIANLLTQKDPVPIVYPEKVNLAAYPSIPQFDEETQQQVMMENPMLKQALDEAKRVASLTGHYLEEEFRKQMLIDKVAYMLVLAAKHGISYMQVFYDREFESMKTIVHDAFDIYTTNVNELEDSPFLIKSVPILISQIKSNEMFDEEQREKINPDNKLANSEIKEAYLKSKYGSIANIEQTSTIMFNEALIKEYLTDENMSTIRSQEDGEEILKGREKGDTVIRQVFTGGNIPLKEKYIKLKEYPFVDFRYEAGSIYQVPLIERFKPANKSLDMIVSRLERILHTMTVGAWIQNESEGNLNISNQAGGQVIKYKAIPPVQATLAGVPSYVFNMMQFLNDVIEEQGVSTSVLGKIPQGVKAARAIESIKESEYAGLIIASKRLNTMVKKVAEKMLDLVDDYFVTPQTVQYLEKGEPKYFDIIGSSALEKRKGLKIENPEGLVPIKNDYRVEIEIQSGVAYTREGQKAAMQELIQEMLAYAQAGYIPPEAIKVAIEKYLEAYEFGSTSEFMEAMDKYQTAGNMDQSHIDAMKVALAEVFKDFQSAGVMPTSEQRIEEGKIATAEAIRDTGLASKETPVNKTEEAKAAQDMSHSEEKHKVTMQGTKQKQQIEAIKAMHDMKLKEEMLKKGGKSATKKR